MGEWNKGRILAKGNQIEHWLNGEKVVEVTWGTDDWKERFQKASTAKMKGFGSWEGPVLLQDHNDPAWYRKLKIKKLDRQNLCLFNFSPYLLLKIRFL